MCEACGIELFECEAKLEVIEGNTEAASLLSMAGRTFAVKVLRVGGSSKEIKGEIIERRIGGIIKNRLATAKVDLRNPHVTFLGILTGGIFSFGILTYRRRPGAVSQRRPKMRPALHPSTMQPKIARCMVNLSRAPTGSWVLDPFCGVGGILVEAEAIGCIPIGCDTKLNMIRGCIKNLEHARSQVKGAVVGDARHLPFRPVIHVATDPPYGTSTSLVGGRMIEILGDFLHNLREVLDKRGFVVLGAPSREPLETAAEENGFAVKEHYELRVHRSLTRHISVLAPVESS